MSRELYSLEAEHGVLGAILQAGLQDDQALLEDAIGSVTVSDFYFEDNAALFEAIKACYEEGCRLIRSPSASSVTRFPAARRSFPTPARSPAPFLDRELEGVRPARPGARHPAPPDRCCGVGEGLGH